MREYVVKQGECLASIARQFGFTDPMAIYNDSGNTDFRRLRPNPNILYPGDRVAIPDRETKTLTCPTDTLVKFQVTLPRKKIRLVVCHDGNPFEGVEYKLVVGNKELTGQTRGNGAIEADVDARATEGTLSLNGGKPELFRIGHLNPMKDTDDSGVSGVQGRLRNLGYALHVDGVLGPRTMAAIRQFEESHGMNPTGEISGELIDKLTRAHGC